MSIISNFPSEIEKIIQGETINVKPCTIIINKAIFPIRLGDNCIVAIDKDDGLVIAYGTTTSLYCNTSSGWIIVRPDVSDNKITANLPIGDAFKSTGQSSVCFSWYDSNENLG